MLSEFNGQSSYKAMPGFLMTEDSKKLAITKETKKTDQSFIRSILSDRNINLTIKISNFLMRIYDFFGWPH